MATDGISGPDDQSTSPVPPAHFSQSPIDQTEIDDLLAKYPFASEPSYFTRPNRYHGPPSTWLSWTADDRAVAESLDVARAADLSVHLFNAFDLKRRARLEASTTARQDADQTSHADDDDEVANHQFTPPDIWTAWPLRNRHVPRNSSFPRTSRSEGGWMEAHAPSTALSDALLAITLRHAKNRWNLRSAESKPLQPDPSKHDWKNERNLTKKEMEGDDSDEEDHQTTLDGQSINDSGITESEADHDQDSTTALPPGTQTFSSQAFAALSSSSSEDEGEVNKESEEDEPVFSADEERARRLLQPSVRHTLTRLDDLLDGLHQARAAYAFKDDFSRSRSRSKSHTPFSGNEITEDERFVRSGSRTESSRRRRKRRKLDPELLDPEQHHISTSRGRFMTRKSEGGVQSYALRDWSDVMGMAVLKGWNIDTVARASERCARLFGQNMAFRTFHHEDDGKDATLKAKPSFEDTLAYVPKREQSDTPDLIQRFPDDPTTTKPETFEYIRTSSACSRCQSLKIRCYAPNQNPLSIDTTTTKRVSCTACTSLQDPMRPCSGIFVKQQARTASTAKICPYPDCPRHNPFTPFAKNYHLQRHLMNIHGHSPSHSGLSSPQPQVYPSSPSAPSTPLLASLPKHAIDTSREAAILPNISTLLTCPVPECPRAHLQSGKPRVYKRATRLYDHIRRVHPDLDVEAFKKIVSLRGEDGRGRYERRSQSRSLSRRRRGGTGEVRDEDVDEDEEGIIGDGEQEEGMAGEDEGEDDNGVGDGDSLGDHRGDQSGHRGNS